MKLLLDQGLPRSAAALLRSHEIDAIHVGEIGFSNADDKTLIHLAEQQDRIVVTLDADFHTILALSGLGKPSVILIRIRIEGLKAEPLVFLLQALLAERGAELVRGSLVTVQPNRVRIRYLPINPSR